MSIVNPYCYTWNLDWTYGVIIVLLSTLDSIDIITPHGQIPHPILWHCVFRLKWL